jgi:hypothetical protein
VGTAGNSVKVYRGYRFGGRCVVVCDGKKIDPRLDLVNHSPTGLEWGYGGSGPAQTALAILADYLNDNEQLAIGLHQKFKWDFIANAPHKGFSITGQQIKGWLWNYQRTDEYEQ